MEEPEGGQNLNGYAKADQFFYNINQMIATRKANGILASNFTLSFTTAGGDSLAEFQLDSINISYIDGNNPTGLPLFDHILPEGYINSTVKSGSTVLAGSVVSTAGSSTNTDAFGNYSQSNTSIQNFDLGQKPTGNITGVVNV